MLLTKAGNSVSPTNGWADGMNEPRVGIVLKVLCRL